MKLLNVDWANLKEITDTKYSVRGSFTPNGLFSQQIFGPVKSYHCACKKFNFKGRYYHLKECPDCGVRITTSYERRKTYAKIVLPFEVINPFYRIVFIKTFRNRNYIRIFDDLVYYRNRYEYNGEEFVLDESLSVRKGDNIFFGLYDIPKFVKKICEIEINKIKKKYGDKYNKTKKYKFINILLTFDPFLKNVLVIPPNFRPITYLKNMEVLDVINHKYLNILKIVNNVKVLPSVIIEDRNNELYLTNYKYLTYTVFDLYNFVLDKIGGKEGLLRGCILGKRVDNSGRAVITPDPELNLDEAGIPYIILLEILKPLLIVHLVTLNYCKTYIEANNLIEKCISDEDYVLFDIVSRFCERMYCILNRQPSLHKYSILSYKIKVFKGNVIRLHPSVCKAYNADFDGDAMAVYIPVDEVSKKDILENLHIRNNIISVNNEVIPSFNQDVVLGIYYLTSKEDNTKVLCKGDKVSGGLFLFNSILPDDYPLIKEPVSGKRLNYILEDIAKKYNFDIFSRVLDNIKDLGFKYSTLGNFTLSIDDLYNEEFEKYIREKFNFDNYTIRDFVDLVESEEVKNKVESLFPSYIYVKSGARGSYDQFKQIVMFRGFVSDFYGNVREYFIKNNLLHGLSPKEFFESCYGCRKGLLDTALSTGLSGYLTRQMIYATLHNKFNKENGDCGTKDTLNVFIKDIDFLKLFNGRYYYDETGELKKVNGDENYLVNKVIRFRSPIYCMNKEFCLKCVGDIISKYGSDYFGIISSQTLGERLTQLVLRTFHTSGVVSKMEEEKDSKAKDIISDMGLVLKVLHNKKDLLENLNSNEEKISRLLFALYSVFSNYGKIDFIHYENIISACMWYGNNPWRLMKNRRELESEFLNIMKVPERISWLTSLLFSNIKENIVYGIGTTNTAR